jgi:two-component system chemotaxis response regulator CheB
MGSHAIRVLLVEDSPIALAILQRILDSSPEIAVVGTARTGKEALTLIPKLQPQVICTDLHMPQMNGLEFIREVMATQPRPILAISNSVRESDTQTISGLLQSGAVDTFPKPILGTAVDYEGIKQALVGKIKVLAGVSVFTQRPQRTVAIESSCRTSPGASACPSAPDLTRVTKVVAIGASTGGPQALYAILTRLPVNFPKPIICIQHISEGFLQGLVDWLARECRLSVKIAGNGEIPRPATIYFAPERYHLELNAFGRFVYSDLGLVGGHCPSIDVTFKSIAKFYGRTTLGILLSGMGRDGAEGLATIARAGGLTIAQDEASCVVFGMPKEAIALGGVQHVLPLTAIAPLLLSRLQV